MKTIKTEQLTMSFDELFALISDQYGVTIKDIDVSFLNREVKFLVEKVESVCH